MNFIIFNCCSKTFRPYLVVIQSIHSISLTIDLVSTHLSSPQTLDFLSLLIQNFYSYHFLQLLIHPDSMKSMNLVNYPFLSLKINWYFVFHRPLLERLTIVTRMTLRHQSFVLLLLQRLETIHLRMIS